MIVGVPKEIKDNEFRVAIVAAGVRALVERGHQVLIESGAGAGSGIADEVYKEVGAEIVPGPEDVYGRSDMILKIKEPLPQEYGYFRPAQIIFTYLHLAAAPELAQALLENKVTGIAYETVQTGDGRLPLLQPMSEVAGRMAAQVGAHLLERPSGGRGVLLSGVPGVRPARVTILGGGNVGINAARVALGLGAEVNVVLRRKTRMVYIDDLFRGRIQCLPASSLSLEQSVVSSDLVIGAVLVPGGRTPRLITVDMVRKMSEGSVLVDVSVDQGGCSETTRPTTHSSPTYEKYGVLHYAVTNMPGAVPFTSTFALTNETLPYVLMLAENGLEKALEKDSALARGVNTFSGKIVAKSVAEALGAPYVPCEKLL